MKTVLAVIFKILATIIAIVIAITIITVKFIREPYDTGMVILTQLEEAERNLNKWYNKGKH